MDISHNDSIHPPDLIHLDMNRHMDTSALVPDSPLSTPPDTPRRPRPDDDPDNGLKGGDGEEEKKEDVDDSLPLQPLSEKDEEEDDMPIDERNSSNDNHKIDEDSIPAGNNKPFDEETPAKNSNEIGEETGPDDEKSSSSAPDDEKNVDGCGVVVSRTENDIPGVKVDIDDAEEEPPSLSPQDGVGAISKDEDDSIEEPPALSRLEEAMKRTSLMVLKHSQRKEKPTPPPATREPFVAVGTAKEAATSAIATSTHSRSESNRLVALQRDIMSLKTSLTDMDMQLQEEAVQRALKSPSVGPDDEKSSSAPVAAEADTAALTIDTNTNNPVIPHVGDVDEIMTPNTTTAPAATEYREMTPKKDLQGSDKSAGWLQEELRRRAVVKREINDAIEARGQGDATNTRTAVDELPSISSPPDLEGSQSTLEDEEVAAITANSNNNDLSGITDDQNLPPSRSQSHVDGATPRRLDYDGQNEQPEDEFVATNTGDELMGNGFQPIFDYQDLQHEMKKFASETRAALREQSFTDIVQDPYSSAVPVAFSSPMSINDRQEEFNPDFQTDAIANSSNNEETNSAKINFSDLESGKILVMLRTMDSFDGIASGDIFLSLLSENAGRTETSEAATWANRVHSAIWRARKMRRSMLPEPPNGHQKPPVLRGAQTVASVQHAAIMHLQRDEINEAISLVEGITFAYYSYFERSLNLQEENLASNEGPDSVDFKPYVGMALHNLGVLHLLNGSYDEALSYFIRAVDNRKSNLGENHPHYIASLVRLATCRYALNEFAEAHAGLEEALVLAKRRRSATLEDRLQMAEILNNLGCLAYMSGQPTSASSYYRDSMDLQFGALSDSLYLGNATSGQSISLNISIARANIGFIKLVTKDLSIAITALENALMEQQILLKGTNDTLIATMDHLAMSNLLNGFQDKAALMYNRILTLQQQEYGPHDRRCFVTVDKINMVQGKGVQYEGAIEELRKTFSMPSASNSSIGGSKGSRSPQRAKANQAQKSSGKKKKNKVLKALSSLKKK